MHDQPYGIEWVAAPDDLAPYLNSLYILRTGDAALEDMMPAYSGQLVLAIKGGGEMEFADGSRARSTAAFFQCPLLQAQKFTLQPQTTFMGVSLNYRGWAMLTGLPVDKYRDRYMAAAEALPASLAEELERIVRRIQSGELSERAAIDEVVAVVRAGMKPLSKRHMEVIDRTLAWLSSSLKPEIEDLLDRLPYSERQVQRLVTRFFGAPPVRLIRRYRAIRAATMLAMPELPEHLEVELREAFYDQAHMIKEIRHFTGRTPRRLQPSVDSVVVDTLSLDGYSSVALFGGGQDDVLAKGRSPA